MDKDVPLTANFNLSEVLSPDTGEVIIDDLFWKTMDYAQTLRSTLGFPLRVNSGHRSVAHNAAVGGAENSMHLRLALDLSPTGDNREEKLRDLWRVAELEMNWGGIGKYETFVHLDRRDLLDRGVARWNG